MHWLLRGLNRPDLSLGPVQSANAEVYPRGSVLFTPLTTPPPPFFFFFNGFTGRFTAKPTFRGGDILAALKVPRAEAGGSDEADPRVPLNWNRVVKQ